uniref:Uncharacterized protein n=1 Tax=Tetranychus urticae TaxID=32264 RepID=T1KUZ8_TETUR
MTYKCIKFISTDKVDLRSDRFSGINSGFGLNSGQLLYAPNMNE